MADQKRRVIYMADPEWEALRGLADNQGITISELVRRMTFSPVYVPPGAAAVADIVIREDPELARVAGLTIAEAPYIKPLGRESFGSPKPAPKGGKK